MLNSFENELNLSNPKGAFMFSIPVTNVIYEYSFMLRSWGGEMFSQKTLRPQVLARIHIQFESNNMWKLPWKPDEIYCSWCCRPEDLCMLKRNTRCLRHKSWTRKRLEYEDRACISWPTCKLAVEHERVPSRGRSKWRQQLELRREKQKLTSFNQVQCLRRDLSQEREKFIAWNWSSRLSPWSRAMRKARRSKQINKDSYEPCQVFIFKLQPRCGSRFTLIHLKELEAINLFTMEIPTYLRTSKWKNWGDLNANWISLLFNAKKAIFCMFGE